MFKILFLLISILLATLFLVYKLFISKLKRTAKISTYVSFITGVIFCYVISAILCLIFENGILSKILYFILGINPFLIGKLATYEKENFFSYLQISVIIIGIVLVLIL